MLAAFPLVIAQLADRRVIAVIAKSLILTVMICVLLGIGLGFVFEKLLIPLFADRLFPEGGTFVLRGIAAGVTLFFGFRIVAIPVLSLFADQVVAAVEARHYPAAAASARAPGIGLSVSLALFSVLRLVLINLALLPVHLALLFTAIGPFVLFFAANALLLGRDLGEMVAVRHVRAADLKNWLRRTRGPRLLLGLFASALFLIPFLNLLAPVMGAALATHLYHRRQT